MRINFILPAYIARPVGGFRVVYEYANVLAEMGHNVTVTLPRVLEKRSHTSRPAETLRGWFWSAKIRLRNRPLVGWQWIDPRVQLCLLEQFDDEAIGSADAVVATAWQTAAPVMRLTERHGRKYYLIQHYETWAGPKEKVDLTWQFDLTVIAISRWLLELGQSMGVSKIVHIPNAIDHDRFRVLTPPKGRIPNVVSLYHSAAFKGVQDALAVLIRFHASHPNIKITMFGTERRGSEIPSWIEYYHNPFQETLVRDVYNNGTVYLSASLAEGWALPPAEAMACGCAFVGTDSGGCRDYAEDGVTALLSPPGDRDTLYANLCKIIDDPELRRKISENGTAKIKTFTWNKSGLQMAEVLGQGDMKTFY